MSKYFKSKKDNKLYRIDGDTSEAIWYKYNNDTKRWYIIGYGYNPNADYSDYIDITRYVENGLLTDYEFVL